MITPDQIAEWERLEREATKGPWIRTTEQHTYSDNPKTVWGSSGPGYGFIATTARAGFDPPANEANAAFIAAARTALPALLARVRELEEALRPQADLTHGDYVLATKYRDGDPGDHWAVGWFDCRIDDRFIVVDDKGERFRASGFRRAERISADEGQWLLDNRDKLEKTAPGLINLWDLLYGRRARSVLNKGGTDG